MSLGLEELVEGSARACACPGKRGEQLRAADAGAMVWGATVDGEDAGTQHALRQSGWKV